MRVVNTTETFYCDMCKTDKSVRGFEFSYFHHDGDRLQKCLQETHLCPRCQERILKYIALECEGGFRFPGNT